LVLALGKPADLYLLDEPSAYLDSEQRIIAAKVIKRFILQVAHIMRVPVENWQESKDFRGKSEYISFGALKSASVREPVDRLFVRRTRWRMRLAADPRGTPWKSSNRYTRRRLSEKETTLVCVSDRVEVNFGVRLGQAGLGSVRQLG